MSAKSEVLAIVCSDIHFSHKPPIARSAEPDWYEAMRRSWEQVRLLASNYSCPIIIAGDIFDKPNPPPELIIWAMRLFHLRMKPIYVIPGQHDLPLHNLADLNKSALGVLVEADYVRLMDEPVCINGASFYPFPWGVPIEPIKPKTDYLKVAVCHSYIWHGKNCYEGAPQELRYKEQDSKLMGYDVAIFGDNHKGFQKGKVFNCGTLMRRKIDEVDYEPQVGILYSNGKVKSHKLDCSQDKFISSDIIMSKLSAIDYDQFVDLLDELGTSALDFQEAVIRFVSDTKSVAPKIRELILTLLKE